MVVGYFPLAKLGALLVKQISKPISNYIKHEAKEHPFFRQYVCVPPAQFYNWVEIQIKMWILNLGKPVNIPVLNEAQAIELGANLLGEAVIFLSMFGILVEEGIRAAKKAINAEAERRTEKEKLKNLVHTLHYESSFQAEKVQTLSKLLLQIVELPEVKKRLKLSDIALETLRTVDEIEKIQKQEEILEHEFFEDCKDPSPDKESKVCLKPPDKPSPPKEVKPASLLIESNLNDYSNKDKLEKLLEIQGKLESNKFNTSKRKPSGDDANSKKKEKEEIKKKEKEPKATIPKESKPSTNCVKDNKPEGPLLGSESEGPQFNSDKGKTKGPLQNDVRRTSSVLMYLPLYLMNHSFET